jgi:nitrate/nitrite-specific signal transduction histidine kinase
VKHAIPHIVEVNLAYVPSSLTVRVADDGTGIPPGALETTAVGEHLGIAGMRTGPTGRAARWRLRAPRVGLRSRSPCRSGAQKTKFRSAGRR